MKKVILNALALLLILTNVSAQIDTPPASPGAEFSTSVGLTDVTINYSRPGVKDRTIFAEDGLVPLGEMWRTGANAATKFTFSDDISLGGVDIAAGSYAVITVPTESTWKVNLYTYESSSWSSYREKEATYSFEAKSTTIPFSVETFTIMVADVTTETASINLLWANTMVNIPLKVSVHDRVMANIKEVMAGPTAGEYYTAGTYLHNSGGDLKLALEYVQKSNEGDNARFWKLRRESLILADLEMTEKAIEVATRSMNMAEKAGNMDFVRMNKASIEEWSN